MDQLNIKWSLLVVACPEMGTSVESKLPDPIHVQAENVRLLGRDVKAAVKNQTKGPLHL